MRHTFEEEEFLDEYDKGDGYIQPKPKVEDFLYIVRYLNNWDTWTTVSIKANSPKQAIFKVNRRLVKVFEKGGDRVKVERIY